MANVHKTSMITFNFFFSECALLLLAHNAPVKIKNAQGWSPLAEAISYGDRQMSELCQQCPKSVRCCPGVFTSGRVFECNLSGILAMMHPQCLDSWVEYCIGFHKFCKKATVPNTDGGHKHACPCLSDLSWTFQSSQYIQRHKRFVVSPAKKAKGWDFHPHGWKAASMVA